MVLAILDHLGQLLCRELFAFEGGEIVLEVHALQKLLVGFAVEQNALRELPVSPRPPALLVVVLQTFGHGVVDDKPDVGFVYAHPEGHSCYNDVNMVVHPLVLRSFLVTFVDVGVVEGSPVASPVQSSAHLLAFPLGEAVDNPGLLAILANDALDVFDDALGLVSDLVVEVRSVKAGLEEVAALDAQSSNDVLLDHFGHSGSETQDGHFRVLLLQGRKVLVFCSEILAPSRHAMHLVYHESLNLSPLIEGFYQLRKLLAEVQFFRGAEYYDAVLGLVEVQQLIEDTLHLCSLRIGSEAVGLDSHYLGLVLLVEDERNQGEHADVDSLVKEGEDLEGETLASSGGHADENVVPFQAALDDCFLIVFKGFDVGQFAEDVLQSEVFSWIVVFPSLIVGSDIVDSHWFLFDQHILDLYFPELVFFADEGPQMLRFLRFALPGFLGVPFDFFRFPLKSQLRFFWALILILLKLKSTVFPLAHFRQPFKLVVSGLILQPYSVTGVLRFLLFHLLALSFILGLEVLQKTKLIAILLVLLDDMALCSGIERGRVGDGRYLGEVGAGSFEELFVLLELRQVIHPYFSESTHSNALQLCGKRIMDNLTSLLRVMSRFSTTDEDH